MFLRSAAARACRSVVAVRAHLGELGYELDALRFAPGQRRALLTERKIAEPDFLQQREGVMDGRVRGEKISGFVHAHQQHVADALALEAHGERLGIEARAAARFARQLHVGQEAHLDALQPLSFAHLAASARGVEGETRGGVAAHARFRHFRIKPAHRVPEADIGRRA